MTTPILPSNILDQVAGKSSLAEGAEGVRSILLQLFRYPEGINNKILSQYTGIPVPVLAATRQELIKANVLKDISTFTKEGREFVQKGLGFTNLAIRISLDDWNPFSQDLTSQMSAIIGKKGLEIVKSLLKDRPDPAKELDQSRATEETLYRRFLLMFLNGHIEGRTISLLGDDDALSIILLSSGMAHSITVFDIDTRILKYINYCSEQINEQVFSNIKPKEYLSTVEWDLRKPFSKQFTHTQEIIFTDPPYTVPGARLFLHRGRELLNENIGLPLYLAFGPKEPQTHWELQLSSLNYGFKLSELRKQFNRYQGNLRLGQFSDLYVFQVVNPRSRLIQQTHLGEIYTKEVRMRNQNWKEIRNKLKENEIKEEKTNLTIGYHLIAEFMNIPSNHFSVDFLKASLLEACQESELTIIDLYSYLFSPHGLTIIVILQESHISVHTWPEYQFISLDIFVCEEQTKAEKALEYLIGKIKPQTVTKLPVIRGEYIKENLK